MNRLKPHAEGTLHKKLVYIRNNWQLYVFFMLPALALTIVFKYLPMGGLAIAFQDYNNRKGIWGSDFIGFAHFMRFLNPIIPCGYLKCNIGFLCIGLH